MTSASRTFILLTALALGGCGVLGGKDAQFVEQGAKERNIDVRTGPETKGLLKTLPKGLLADKANAKHTYETLKGVNPDDKN